MSKRIAIFASGTGSNARKIVEHFKGHADVEVALILSNKRDAKVLDMAAENNIPTQVISRQYFYETTQLVEDLSARGVDFIVLAGFLWLVPTYLVHAFHQKMINIHPALLPQYGGKGMHGMHVHEAVKAAGETESGITIHFVNEQYDEGGHIFQVRCTLSPNDSPEDIARKVLALEHEYLPKIVEKLLLSI